MKMSDKYIGVDVGGTKIAVAVLEDGALEHQGIKRTDATDADALIAEICALSRESGPTGSRRSASACRRWSTSRAGPRGRR